MVTPILTFLLFAAFSGLRIFSYLPQIRRVALDRNGATAISYATWALWTGSNVATALYALANLGDVCLALVSTVNAVCCLTVIALTAMKRQGIDLRALVLSRLVRPARRPSIRQRACSQRAC
jgi:DMSO reductase anchor subunit